MSMPSRRGSLTPPPNAVETVLRVRYAETDQMGVAYYGRYLEWFEAARGVFSHARGIPYSVIEKEYGLGLPVVEAHCRYLSPARYDDEVVITTWIAERTRRTVRWDYVLRRGDTRLAEGSTTHVLVGRDGRPTAWPTDLGARLDGEAPTSSDAVE